MHNRIVKFQFHFCLIYKKKNKKKFKSKNQTKKKKKISTKKKL